MAVIDDFKTRFPEFDAAQVDAKLPVLVDAYPCYWGGDYEECGKEIVLNLLAHLLVVTTKGGDEGAKAIQSKSVGNVSVSYGQEFPPASNRMAWFNATKYGKQFLLLTRHRQGGFFV